MQLEPVNEEPVYGCRIVRFVDGGPNNPGQARQSGKIKPGDLVMKVEAEGQLMAATTYEEIIDLLKHTHVKRILTIRSVWEDQQETDILQQTPHDRLGFIPTRKASSIKNVNTSRFQKPKNPSSLAQPVVTTPPRNNNVSRTFDADMIHSPSETVLLSQSLDDLSRISVTKSPKDLPPDGPMIASLCQNGEHGNGIESRDDNNNNVTRADSEEDTILLSRSGSSPSQLAQEEINDDENQPNNDHEEEDPILLSRSASFHSQQTAKSSNKSHLEMAPQALADQFLLFDGYAGCLVPESSYTSYSTSIDSVTTRVGENAGLDDEQCTLDEDFRSPSTIKGVEGSIKTQIRHQQDLLDRSLMRAEFEQLLQAARVEHSKTERELKDLYVQTCERNESKIRELQKNNSKLQQKAESLEASNNDLQEELGSRAMELEMTRTMSRELEARIKLVEKEKNDLTICLKEAYESIQEMRDAARLKKQESQSDKQQLSDQKRQISLLTNEANNAKSELKRAKEQNKELSVSIKDIGHMHATELHHSRGKILSLEEKLKLYQTELESTKNENIKLSKQVEGYESYKRETMVLTEKLTKSMEEKQQELMDRQSVVSTLKLENESLASQISETNRDVELLLQSKQEMEAKLATTWKDYEQAKKDASAVHEKLMEKLENGEFFTAADIEEKNRCIENLNKQLDTFQQSSKQEIRKAAKTSVNLEIKLRGSQQQLTASKLSNAMLTLERDNLATAMDSIKVDAIKAKDQIQLIAEMFRSERAHVDDLQQQMLVLRQGKEDAATSYKCEIQALESELGKLRCEMATIMSSREETEILYEELKENLDAKSKEIAAMQTSLSQLEKSRQAMNSLNINLRKELESVTAVKHRLEMEQQEYIAKTAAQLSALQDTEMRVNELLAQQVEIDEKNEALKEQIASKNEVISSFEINVIGMKDEINTLINSKHALVEKNKALMQQQRHAGITYRRDTEVLRNQVNTKQMELSVALKQMDEINKKGASENSLQELRNRLEAAVEENETAAMTYWEDIQDLTSELQDRNEALSFAEARVHTIESEMQKVIRDKHEMLEQLNRTNSHVQELKTELASQSRLLDCSESQRTKLDKSNNDLRTKIIDYELQLSESAAEISFLNDRITTLTKEKHTVEEWLHKGQKRARNFDEQIQRLKKKNCMNEIQYRALKGEAIFQGYGVGEQMEILKMHCDSIEKKNQFLQASKDSITMTCCSEVFRLVKRIAVLESYNAQFKLERNNALIEVVALRASEKRLSSIVEELQKELSEASDQKTKLYIELEQCYDAENDEEKLIDELVDKTRQLELQNKETITLHAEIESLVSVVNHLEKGNAALRKEITCASAAASDARMELNINQKRINSLISSKDESILKSENIRSKMSRSLLHANATVASFTVQLKQKDIELQDFKYQREVYDLVADELARTHESLQFLQLTLQEKDDTTTIQAHQIENLNIELERLRNELAQKEDEVECSYTQSPKLLFNESHNYGEQPREQIKEVRLEHDTLPYQSNRADVHNFKPDSRSIKVQSSEIESVYFSDEIGLKEDLNTITQEMQSLSNIAEKRSAEIDVLYQTITDLATRLKEKEDGALMLVLEKEALEDSLSTKEARLEAIEKARLKEIVGLQKMVLSTRAEYIVLRLRKQRLQETLDIEKKDLLENIEDLSQKLLAMEGNQQKDNGRFIDLENQLKKSILKSRAEYVAKHLEVICLKKDLAKLEMDQRKCDSLTSTRCLQIEYLEKLNEKKDQQITAFLSKRGSDCNEILTLRSKVEDLSATVTKSSEDATIKEETTAKLTLRLQQLESDKRELDKKNTQLLVGVKKICIALIEESKQVGHLKKLITQRENELKDEKDEVKSLNFIIEILKGKNTRLQQKLKENSEILLEESKKRRGAALALTEEIERSCFFQWKCEQKACQAESLADEKIMLEHRSSQLQSRTGDINEMHCFKIEQQQQAIDSLTSQLDDIRAERDDQTKFSGVLCLELEQKTELINSLVQEKEALMQDTNEKMELNERSFFQNQLHVSELRELKDKIKAMEHEKIEILAELTKVKKILDAERAIHGVTVVEKEGIAQQMEIISNETLLLRERLEKSANEIAHLQKKNEKIDNETIENERKELEEKVTISKAEVSKKNDECLKLQKWNELLSIQIEEMKKNVQELQSSNDQKRVMEEEIQRYKMQANEKERHILYLEDSIDSYRQTYEENEETIAEKESTVRSLERQLHDKERQFAEFEKEIVQLKSTIDQTTKMIHQTTQDHDRDDMADHVTRVKEAYKKQTTILEDLKLSEIVLSSFIGEVTHLANNAEKEALKLSATLNTVEDLLIRPSSCLASLDLAGLDTSLGYIDEVRTKLEDMASLAYNTSVELKVRQNEFNQWKASREAIPAVPITPPSIKLPKRILFAEDGTVADFRNKEIELRSKIAGAKVLSCVLEKRSKLELASAFRKWTCNAGAISASSSHKETAVALAQQLEQTREKLLILKSHLKGKKPHGRPRLRRILDRLESTSNNGDENISDIYVNQSFEI